MACLERGLDGGAWAAAGMLNKRSSRIKTINRTIGRSFRSAAALTAAGIVLFVSAHAPDRLPPASVHTRTWV
jgi:hypothetical protein